MKESIRSLVLLLVTCLFVSLPCAALAAAPPLDQILSIVDASISNGDKATATLQQKHGGDELFGLVSADCYKVFNLALADVTHGLRDFQKKSDPKAMVYKDFVEKDGVYTFTDVLINPEIPAEYSLSYTYAPKANYIRCDITGTGDGRAISITAEFLKKGSSVYAQLYNNVDGIVTKFILSKSVYQAADFDEDEPLPFQSLVNAPKSLLKNWKSFSKGSYVSFVIKRKTLSVLLFDKPYSFK